MKKEAITVPQDPREFERLVATLFRTLGAERVEHDVALAGSQIDLLVQETTAAGTTVRSAVECKAFARPVGIDIVLNYAALAGLLKQRNLIHRAILVASSGFSRQAREAAEAHGIELFEIDDLLARANLQPEKLRRVTAEFVARWDSAPEPKSKKVFVVMPFAREFQDIYVLGIREVAEKLGLVVERADDIEHNENILDVVLASIRACDVVVADTSTKNPNCFYEIGYAHAMGKPTVLISREGEAIPFDLRAMNHLFYSTIVELREALAKRLAATLKLEGR